MTSSLLPRPVGVTQLFLRSPRLGVGNEEHAWGFCFGASAHWKEAPCQSPALWTCQAAWGPSSFGGVLVSWQSLCHSIYLTICCPSTARRFCSSFRQASEVTSLLTLTCQQLRGGPLSRKGIWLPLRQVEWKKFLKKRNP